MNWKHDQIEKLILFYSQIVCFWYQISGTRNPATGTRKLVPDSGTSFLLPDSGTSFLLPVSGTSFWSVCHGHNTLAVEQFSVNH